MNQNTPSGPETEKLQRYLFIIGNTTVLTGIIIADLYTYLEFSESRILVIGGLIMLPFLFLSFLVHLKKNYQTGFFILCLCTACIVLPVGFFASGGILSGMPVYFSCFFILCMFSLDRKQRRISFSISVFIILFLILFELCFPARIRFLDRKTARTDIIFAVFSIIPALSLFISRFMKSYTSLNRAQIRALEYNNQLFQELLQNETEKTASLRQFRHDVRHREAVLLELLENGNTEKAIALLKETGREIPGNSRFFCLNLTLNSILNYMDRFCAKNGISLTVSADVNEHTPVSSIDLCTIVSNLLENAIHGAMESGCAERSISFRAVTSGNRLILTCENTCASEVTVRNGMLPAGSTGIQSICAAIKLYDGTIGYSLEAPQQLKCTILLNL